jgi:putative effector of murein hydrolase
MSIFSSSLGLVALTIAAYSAGNWLYLRSGKLPVPQPVMIATIALVALLLSTGLPYSQYFNATSMLHSLLGPAVVALAVPLYENVHKARAALLPIVLATLLGGLAVTGSALLLGHVFGLSPLMERALSTKSVTTPIALSVADKIGGSVPLTILGVFVTGLAGVTLTPESHWRGQSGRERLYARRDFPHLRHYACCRVRLGGCGLRHARHGAHGMRFGGPRSGDFPFVLTDQSGLACRSSACHCDRRQPFAVVPRR